jgi:hypothetical protein
MVLFWVENAIYAFSSIHLECLRISYSLGLNEGWIALKRNVVALASFERLPPDVGEMAIREFASSFGVDSSRHSGDLRRTRLADTRFATAAVQECRPCSPRGFCACSLRGCDIKVPHVKSPDPRACIDVTSCSYSKVPLQHD